LNRKVISILTTATALPMEVNLNVVVAPVSRIVDRQVCKGVQDVAVDHPFGFSDVYGLQQSAVNIKDDKVLELLDAITRMQVLLVITIKLNLTGTKYIHIQNHLEREAQYSYRSQYRR
jgi:hypothetical protein